MSAKKRKRKRRRIRRERIIILILVPVLLLAILGVVIGLMIHKNAQKKAVQPASEIISTEPESDIVSPGMSEPVSEQDSQITPDGDMNNPPALEISENVNQLVAGMTLHEKVCQMFVVSPETITGVGTQIQAGEQTKAALESTPVGGICLFAKNLQDAEQTKSLIGNMQSYARANHGISLFVSVDEEGGDVTRVAARLGTTKLEPMYTYKDEGPDKAYQNAQTIGKDIYRYGFNLDFAPVADIWSNPQNQVIGTRAYSDNAAQVTLLMPSAVKGFHDANVMCTLKHFPGHGDTKEDSHVGSAFSYKTLEELNREEFLPFKAGINAGADMVMIAHVTVPEVDSLPASISPKMHEILRNDLGFNGVIITDSLAMQALTSKYSNAEIGVKCVEAGNDILLCQGGAADMIAAIEAAVNNGQIEESRIDESVKRILALKEKYGLIIQ